MNDVKQLGSFPLSAFIKQQTADGSVYNIYEEAFSHMETETATRRSFKIN